MKKILLSYLDESIGEANILILSNEQFDEWKVDNEYNKYYFNIVAIEIIVLDTVFKREYMPWVNS